MCRKFTLLIFIVILYTYSKNQLIDVSTPYSSGIIDITPFGNLQQEIFYFSNGTILSLKSLFGWSLMSNAYYGALAIDDSITRAYYKHDINIEKYYDYFGGSNNSSIKWLYSVSFRSSDTVWENSLVYPDSLTLFDSIAIEENNDTTVNFLQGKCYALDIQNETNPMFWDENILQSYNTIFYLTGPENIHFKIQIYDYEYGHSPNETYLKYVHLRWAIDSCGNKKFISDSTGIHAATYNRTETAIFPLKIANQDGKLTLCGNYSKKRMILKIFDLKGRVLFNKIIKNNSILNLKAGNYLLHVNIGNKKYCKAIIVL